MLMFFVIYHDWFDNLENGDFKPRQDGASAIPLDSSSKGWFRVRAISTHLIEFPA